MDSKKPVLSMAASQRFNHFLMSLDEENRKWINSRMVLGRVFSFYGKYGIVHEDLRDPYDLITKRLISVAQGLLDKNPPFYFDIETHFTGVDIIKLEPNRTYKFDAISRMLGKLDPHGEVYPAEESSILISMIAYKVCLELSKEERFETGMRKYRECLETLEKSQLQKEVVRGRFFKFL